LVLRLVTRQRTRTALTVLGVATAMFLYATIESLQAGVAEATRESGLDTTLVVYRENRFCPFTSRLPEYYEPRLRRVPGVAAVVPMKVVVNNCRASLDVVTYRGVRKEHFLRAEGKTLRVLSGSIEDWKARTDAALVGSNLAERRGFKVGDRFDSSGITVTVAAVVVSDEPQHRNVAYVDLEFLQRAPGIDQVGIVTQFNVRVDDPTRIDEIAAAIDAEFESDEDPTTTRSEKAFVARAAGDAMELIAFTRWVALGCLAAVIALVANSIVLSVQDRVRDIAVMQTLGYRGSLVGRLVLTEGLVLSLAGGAIGILGAIAFLTTTDLSLSNEGLSIGFGTGPEVWAAGLLVSALLGVVAGLYPAIRAARVPIAASFRAV
jgi:putative ABC transport system permease protein